MPLTVLFLGLGVAQGAQPTSVAIAGSLQDELGCEADWQPACASTFLVFDANDGVWQKTFTVPAGSFEYKAALNGGWDENYGANATPGGANIPLQLEAEAAVKFYYDHATHWVTTNKGSIIATAPGSFQKALGCSGDWDPGCLRSWLQDPDGDGVFSFTTGGLPAGSYEVKVAIGESWDENYGVDGVRGGANIAFTVPSDCATMRFVYDSATHVLAVTADTAPATQPSMVVIPGSLQSEAGCSGDWQPDCASTALAFDANDGVWQGSFDLPAGSFEYKAALNGSWSENYGGGARRDGPNIGLTLAEAARVKFYYDHATHWVTSNRNAVIATVAGSFQSELGCAGDWDPGCLRSWLQDADGDGFYTFTTRKLPAGNFEAKVTVNESWDENYGAGGERNGPNIAFSVTASCEEVVFTYDATSHKLTVGKAGGPKGNLGLAQAHWVSRDVIVWKLGAFPEGTTYALHGAVLGGLKLTEDGITGGESVPLTRDNGGIGSDLNLREKFPHLVGLAALRMGSEACSNAARLIKGQLAVEARGPDGKVLDATSLQIPGVLDDRFHYEGPLGVTWENGAPVLRVWAPTARSVKLLLYADSGAGTEPAEHEMSVDTTTGVWSVTGEPSWKWQYYLFEVEVFVRGTGQVEHNRVTDPYSLSLSTNSRRSQIVDLSDPTLLPPEWPVTIRPRLASFEDVVLYELHIRDFSASEARVPEELRGTYKAFTYNSRGTRQLRALAEAGLTHVHLLPAFDYATVNEDRSTWQQPAGDLAAMPPASEQQQAAVAAVRDLDGFNWGYDPYHYTVPEGSYAQHPDGGSRIREFREMVQALNRMGLRVVMDVVYNHTTAAGQNDRSVLDRIVPGYYHRLNADGNIETSTCCQNTATEHAMMEKLMVDSLLVWAKYYKVEGFRFDLMGHHMKANMEKARDALRGLTLARDGVDGSQIYIYGEAWNFGEVADNARGVNAIQANMAGTGIGSFNDRLRDGARGGGPFAPLRDQGFISGLYLDPNDTSQGTPAEQKARLLHQADWIRAGLAGSIAGYTFQDATGQTVTAAEVDYNGQHSGYTADPQEVINYVSAHDNETLFDAVQAKAPATADLGDRLRMHNLGISLVALAQGVPFFHAGDELLRSKSLDRNSYNSGDWFNRLDYSMLTTTWGSGLPPAEANQSVWPILAPLLADPQLAPDAGLIAQADAHFKEMIAIRKSSRLFRLPTGEDVKARVKMYNTGPDQLPGLIVMGITSSMGQCTDLGTTFGRRPGIVVVFNASPMRQSFVARELRGLGLKLHPIQASSEDRTVRLSRYFDATGTFSVPGRTTAVFVCGEMPVPN